MVWNCSIRNAFHHLEIIEMGENCRVLIYLQLYILSVLVGLANDRVTSLFPRLPSLSPSPPPTSTHSNPFLRTVLGTKNGSTRGLND